MKHEPGRKDDSKKLKWTLLPMQEISDVIGVLMKGAEKYAAWNWKLVKGGEDRYLNAAYRHLAEISSGKKTDPEWGFSHYAHAICSLLFAFWHSRNNLRDVRRARAEDDGPVHE